jgi:hypothetical protein
MKLPDADLSKAYSTKEIEEALPVNHKAAGINWNSHETGGMITKLRIVFSMLSTPSILWITLATHHPIYILLSITVGFSTVFTHRIPAVTLLYAVSSYPGDPPHIHSTWIMARTPGRDAIRSSRNRLCSRSLRHITSHTQA